MRIDLAAKLERRRANALEKVGRQILLREIDHRLEMRQRLDQHLAPTLIALAPGPTLPPRRLTALPLRLRRKEIGEPLALGQIELAVGEGPARELPRLCRTKPVELPQARDQRGHDGRAPMRMKLGDVL